MIKEGKIKDTVEVSEDMFIEYDEKDEPVGIELWRARTNVFGEMLKYLNKLTEVKGTNRNSLTLSVNIIFTALGLRPQTPADAPPMAGFNMKSPVAYNYYYSHDQILIHNYHTNNHFYFLRQINIYIYEL